MNMYLNIILLILLAMVLGWREIQILIMRGSYYKENLRFNPYWYKDQNSKEKYFGLFPKKNFDSFHVANGLAVVLILLIGASKSYVSLTGLIGLSLADVQPIGIALDIIIYWVIFMQIRNLAMWLIYKK